MWDTFLYRAHVRVHYYLNPYVCVRVEPLCKTQSVCMCETDVLVCAHARVCVCVRVSVCVCVCVSVCTFICNVCRCVCMHA